MRELNVNEIEQVNGGVVPLGVAAGAYTVAKFRLIYKMYKLAKKAGEAKKQS